MHPIREANINFETASPLAMGAGQIDPNKALDPGLIFDATPQDYVNLICSFRRFKPQIKTITRSSNYSCVNPSSDLNHPSIITSYTFKNFMRTREFQRTVTNVGEGATIYNAAVIASGGFEVAVMPRTLVFARKYEKQSYKIALKGKKPIRFHLVS